MNLRVQEFIENYYGEWKKLKNKAKAYRFISLMFLVLAAVLLTYEILNRKGFAEINGSFWMWIVSFISGLLFISFKEIARERIKRIPYEVAHKFNNYMGLSRNKKLPGEDFMDEMLEYFKNPHEGLIIPEDCIQAMAGDFEKHSNYFRERFKGRGNAG